MGPTVNSTNNNNLYGVVVYSVLIVNTIIHYSFVYDESIFTASSVLIVKAHPSMSLSH